MLRNCYALTKIDQFPTLDGHNIESYELSFDGSPARLSEWAKHFRQHYCPDEEIDALRKGTGLTRKDYLNQLIFPDSHNAPGPSVRAGDFAEILILNYVEFTLGYTVFRDKYAEKEVRNESVKGVDIIGFKLAGNEPSAKDSLLTFEVKAQLTSGKYSGCLQKAITDSRKDFVRLGGSLHAAKRRAIRAGLRDAQNLIERFQSYSNLPYVFQVGAAAVVTAETYDKHAIQAASVDEHENVENLQLIVIKRENLMRLADALFEVAANEA